MTTTGLHLSVTVASDDQTTPEGVFADLTQLATNYAGIHEVLIYSHDMDDPADELTDEQLGRIAFDAAHAVALTDPQDRTPFADLPAERQRAWIAAALAARNA